MQHTEISLRASKLGLAFEKPFLYLLKKLTGESSLKLTGKQNQKGELKPSTQKAASDNKKTPEALTAKCKQMKKKSPAGAKDKSADISVAAATPLPKVDEQEGFWIELVDASWVKVDNRSTNNIWIELSNLTIS